MPQLTCEPLQFPSADGQHTSAAVVYTMPGVPVRAVLQLSHGMCEYVRRYEPMAQFYAAHGIALAGNDHLGHGDTARPGELGFYGTPGGRRYLVQDLHTMNALLHQKFPGLPVFLYGHSMGSFFARWYAARWPESIDGLVICGTGGPNPLGGVGLALTKLLSRVKGPKYRSALINELAFGSYLRRIPDAKTPYDWISRDEEIVRAYETGKGKLTLRAKVHIEDGSAGRKLIVITEVPYQVPKAAMLEKILKLSEEKKVQLGGIYDIRDETDRTGLRAVIELKRDVDPMQILSVLYKYSDLQVTFGVNMVAIADGRPVQMGVKAMLTYYIEHQKRVITRRTQYELEQARAREHILAGLMVAVNHLDEVIALIRKSKSPKEAKEQLMNRFGLTDIQAQAILDMRLQRLTGLEIEALKKEYMAILKTIERLEGILKSEKKLIGVIRAEMLEIRDKYGDERRTELIADDSDKMPVVENKAIAEETAILRLRDGQLRRMSPRMVDKYIAQPGAREDVVEVIQTTTDASLYFFTNLGNCFMLDISKIPETMRLKERGSLLTGLIAGLADGEHAVAMVCTRTEEMEKKGELLFITKNGQVKRTAAGEYGIRRSRFAAISLKGDDELVGMVQVEPGDKDDLVLVTKLGFAVRFKLDTVSPMGRATAGVRGISLSDGDEVRWFEVPKPGDMLMVISDRGFGKRMLCEDIERQGRGGKGQRLLPFTKAGDTGRELAGFMNVTNAESVIVTQKHGHVSQMNVGEVAVERRSGKGQMLVSVLLDDVVTSAAAVMK